jgi:DNA-binding MarR family transcriptional regulator
MLGTPLAMKDLGRRMHCDPSFITGIADTLERNGLAARESDPGDRRVKRLVLTPAGAELKRRLEDEILARTPWRRVLSADERASLLALVHKMSPPLSATDGCPAEEVSEFLSTAAPLAAQPARRQGRDSAGSGPATPPSAGSGPATPPSAGSGPATPPRVPAPAAQ